MMWSGADPISELHLTSAPADLGQLYPWLDEAAGGGAIDPQILARMHITLEEAVANVALHGFVDGGIGRIVVRLSIDAAAAVIDVEDTGVAFDPTAAIPRERVAMIKETLPGGWGLGLIRQFCPEFSYARRGDTNHLTLRFPLVA
jgi:anti-sigma regulatory factor (Ser/Thr protein kinase)